LDLVIQPSKLTASTSSAKWKSGAAGSASVIIACYDDACIVERSLAAFSRQSFDRFEIIIADDGSRHDYGPILQRWAPRFANPIQHVRHEDLGFRKTRILNRAVYVSRFERLIFVDMDCLPHEDFVRNHVRYLRPGVAFSGRRVLVDRKDVPTAQEIRDGGLNFGPLRLVALWLRGRARLIEHGIVLPFTVEIANRGVLGCNFSVWKTDLAKINGFNAEGLGMGWEDTDVDFRLQVAGVKVKVLRHKFVEYHVEHAVRVSGDPVNLARLEAIRKNRVVRAPVGLDEVEPSDFQHMVYGA
jgi:glycosyltransferase involved in cell wall biosynthesis